MTLTLEESPDKVPVSSPQEYCSIDSIIKNLERLQIVHDVVDYPYETITCKQKFALWEEDGIRDKIRSHHGSHYHVDIVKSLLLRYQRENQEHYIIACTLASQKVDFNELRVEFGLSRHEAESLNYQSLDESVFMSQTGCRRGEITPLIAEDKQDNVDGIYFTRDLMIDAMDHPHKLYDFPLDLQQSLFVNAANLFYFLRPRSNKYRTSSDLEGVVPFEVIRWNVKEVVPEKSGYPFIFTDTEIEFREQEYRLKNPRKNGGCIALPFSRTKEGSIVFENHGMKIQRVVLPINYEILLNSYTQNNS